jgi:hypothetical protein
MNNKKAKTTECLRETMEITRLDTNQTSGGRYGKSFGP